MITKRTVYYFLQNLFLLTILSACGGGGSSSSSSAISDVSFTASQTRITAGEQVSLLAKFKNGDGSINHNVGPVQSAQTKIVSPSVTTNYILTVTNATETETRSINIVVDPAPKFTLKINPVENTGNEIRIVAKVLSSLELSSITASVGSHTTALTRVNRGAVSNCRAPFHCFAGVLPSASLTSTAQTLTVRAQDTQGDVITKTQTISIDRTPTLTVSNLPVNQTIVVLNAQLPLNISCHDDHGDCTISMQLEEYRWYALNIQPKHSPVNQTLDLSNFVGKKVTLEIVAEDSAGQKTYAQRVIFVESSDKFSLLKQFSGNVVDFDGQRVLVNTQKNGKDVLSIHQLASNQVSQITMPADPFKNKVSHAYLTSAGVLFQTAKKGEQRAASIGLFEWRDSALSALASNNQFDSVRVAGDYAAWSDHAKVYRRQFSSATTVEIHPLHQRLSAPHTVRITNNGLVAFVTSDLSSQPVFIEKYANGVVTELTRQREVASLEADGLAFVYQATESSGHHVLKSHDGRSETSLSTLTNEYYQTYSTYQINNGWVAFTKQGSNEQKQLWTRSPSNSEVQRSLFINDSEIDSLADDGDLMFKHEGKRYLSRVSGELAEVGSSLGRSIKIKGTWYIIMGGSLLKLL